MTQIGCDLLEVLVAVRSGRCTMCLEFTFFSDQSFSNYSPHRKQAVRDGSAWFITRRRLPLASFSNAFILYTSLKHMGKLQQRGWGMEPST